MSRKESTKLAIERYLGKVERKRIGPTRKNKKPEKEVEKQCLAWMRSQGWDVNIYEAKATYDPRSGCYRNQSMKAGTVDCQGTLPSGISVYVEFKAPGCRSDFNRKKSEAQKHYLSQKIRMNAFGCVVDGAELLEDIYTNWLAIKNGHGDESAMTYLFSRLP